jgi:hypothetical protein
MRDHARNAGPPKKSFKLEMLMLNFSCRFNIRSDISEMLCGAEFCYTISEITELLV